MNDNDKTTDELIRDTHDMVSALIDETVQVDATPRWDPGQNSETGKILTCLLDMPTPATVKEVSSYSSIKEGTVSAQLSELWKVYLVDRDDKPPYHYTASELGQQLIDEWEQQTTLDGESNKSDTPEVEESEKLKAWHKTDLTKRQYIALSCINEYDGRPKSKDIDDEFCERVKVTETPSSSYKVSRELTALFKGGYVGRPPSQPYFYWVSDKGSDVLEE
jgi:DNA-binding transcriptional regulator GbsR (MarR family)